MIRRAGRPATAAILFITLLTVAASSYSAQYAAEMGLYRISGTNLSLREPGGRVEEQWQVQSLGMATDGRLSIGSTGIELGATDEPLPISSLEAQAGVEVLGRPNIVFDSEDGVYINIERLGLEYLEPSGTEGHFELKHSDGWTGLRVKLTSIDVKEDTARFDFGFDTSYIRDRQILEGTSIKAGKPVVQTLSTNAKIAVTFEHRTALISRMGDASDDVVVMFITLRKLPPGAEPELTQSLRPSLRQYHVEMKLLQVYGEPDWTFWTQRFERPYSIGDGAGRVLGPVAIAAELDLLKSRAHIGFPKAGQDDVQILSAPRVTGVLDRKRLMEENPEALPEILRATDPAMLSTLIAYFDSLLPAPSGLTVNDLKGKVAIADIDSPDPGTPGKFRWPDAASPGEGEGVMFIAYVQSTGSPDALSASAAIALRRPAMEKRGKSWQPAEGFLATQFDCSWETISGGTVAFLIPIRDDEYLVVLAAVGLIDGTFAHPR